LPATCSARTAARRAPCIASRYDRQNAQLIPARALSAIGRACPEAPVLCDLFRFFGCAPAVGARLNRILLNAGKPGTLESGRDAGAALDSAGNGRHFVAFVQAIRIRKIAFRSLAKQKSGFPDAIIGLRYNWSYHLADCSSGCAAR
jgi:hypothetical protein